MKNNRDKIVLWLALALFCISLNIVGKTSTYSIENRVAFPTPTPNSAKSSKEGLKPTASTSPTPFPTPVAVQTLDEVQAKIRQRISAPDVSRGRVGIKIVSLNTGKVIFENDPDKYFIPASNMKNFTVAAALESLGPDFRFVTSVFAGAKPDGVGTIKGDLRIYGRGDISISTAFNNGDYYKGLDNLADKIVAAGVKSIEGSIVGDESYFKGYAIPPTWEWNDLQWYYGAEISALPINDNSVDLAVTPAAPGAACSVTISPATTLMQVVNLCTTTGRSIPRNLDVVKKLDRNTLEITGSMPAGDPGFKGYVTFTHPAELFMSLLKQRLELKGVVITGAARTLPPKSSITADQIEIAELESPPFSLIAAKTMKPSQNLYTETILWTLGEYGRPRSGLPIADSYQLGLREITSFLTSIGVPADAIRQYDGSGLSRRNLATPSAIVALYTYMAKQSKYKQAWRDSLTIGGVDGTLTNRFKGAAAAENFRGKTGTMEQVSALSGYVTTAGGEQIVVSIIVNGVASPRTRTWLIDDIVVQLANFNGKVD